LAPGDKNIASDFEKADEKAPTNIIEWVLDSGYRRHMTGCANLHSSNIAEVETSLYLPDGSTVRSTKRGTVNLMSEISRVVNYLEVVNVELVSGSRTTPFIRAP
jgi:hypothetical protein